MSAHPDNFTGKVFGPLYAARGMNEHVAVAKFPVGKYRDRAKRRAAADPAEKYSHLQLAHVEF